MAAGLLEPIKVNPGWDKAAPPPEARATKPMRMTTQPRGILKKPLDVEAESRVPFRTPQARRYEPSGKPHKLHAIKEVSNDQQVATSDDDIPALVGIDDEDGGDDEEVPAPVEEPDEVEIFFQELYREYEVLRDGTRLYRMSDAVVADLPQMEVQLLWPMVAGGPDVSVSAALDTCATGSYIAESLADTLRPHLDPTAFRQVRSVVRMGAPPDHVSNEQLTLKLRWTEDGQSRESVVRFIILQTKNLQVILGLNAILFAGFMEPMFSVLRRMRAEGLQALERLLQLRSLRDSNEEEEVHYLCMSRRVSRSVMAPNGPQRSVPASSRNHDRRPRIQPEAPSVVADMGYPVNDDAVGQRWRMLCPTANMTPRDVHSWRNVARAHDAELSRYLRGDHYSYVPRVAPFYYMTRGNELRQEPITPAYCIPNVNGRYTVWYDQLIWQWGIFVGHGAGVRFEQFDSHYELMAYLYPPIDLRQGLPYADLRWQEYRESRAPITPEEWDMIFEVMDRPRASATESQEAVAQHQQGAIPGGIEQSPLEQEAFSALWDEEHREEQRRLRAEAQSARVDRPIPRRSRSRSDARAGMNRPMPRQPIRLRTAQRASGAAPATPQVDLTATETPPAAGVPLSTANWTNDSS